MATTCSSPNDCLPKSPFPKYSRIGKLYNNNADGVTTTQDVATLFINIAIYLIYAVLLVALFYYLSIGIYKIVFGEDMATVKTAKELLTRAGLIAIGLLVLTSFMFIIISLLKLIGVQDVNGLFWFL